jgi:hypothetical protein
MHARHTPVPPLASLPLCPPQGEYQARQRMAFAETLDVERLAVATFLTV